MENLVFAYMASAGRPAREALILTRSIREFGGGFADNPIWVFEPDTSDRLPDTSRAELESLDVRLIPFSVDEAIWKFPFAAKMYAAAQAEELAADQADVLVCMDTHAIVIQEPGALLPGAGKHLGYRPVDHTLIGSRLSEPINGFWDLIYRECGVREEYLFPMTASVDDFEIRPYFNAGLVAVNPAKGIFRVCHDHFQRLYDDPMFEPFYGKDVRYRIFMHQAVLAGAILANVTQEEMKEFPPLINYPLHMHGDYPEELRPASLNDLVTIRYERFFQNPDWQNVIPVRDPLKTWLEGQF